MSPTSLLGFLYRYRTLLLNIALFQLGWLVCILGGTSYALVYVLVATAVHCYVTGNRTADWVCAALALGLGFMHDGLMLAGGVFVLADTFLPPVWLLCLWWLLGLTIRHSVYEIYRRPFLASVLGAISAGFAYFAGVSLSPMEWGRFGEAGVLVIVVAWLFILPLHRLLYRAVTGKHCEAGYEV